MKFHSNTAIIITIIVMVGINIAIFIRGISLSDEIHYFESETARLQEQNVEAEQQIYELSSYTQTASIAAVLDYGKYNAPIYGEIPQYALK